MSFTPGNKACTTGATADVYNKWLTNDQGGHGSGLGLVNPDGTITALTNPPPGAVPDVDADGKLVDGLRAMIWAFISSIQDNITFVSGAGATHLSQPLTGTINAINCVFTAAYNFATIAVYLFGVRQIPGVDYMVTGANQITFTVAPDPANGVTNGVNGTMFCDLVEA